MIIKLTDIQIQTGFTDAKNARNLSDWLRAERSECDIHHLDNEIAYRREFIVNVLKNRIDRIEKKYPETFETVQKFISDENNVPIQNEGVEIVSEIPDITVATDAPEPDTVETTNEISVPVADIERPIAEPREKFREFLTSPNTMLMATVFTLLIFLPFTAMNLIQYNVLKSESTIGQIGIVLMCVFIAAVWDFSILLFALSGKKNHSMLGAVVLFIFMAAKFDYFRLIFDGIGVDGESVQLGIVLTAIVIYSPILVHAFTTMSNVKK
jgi:hypothetical protein